MTRRRSGEGRKGDREMELFKYQERGIERIHAELDRKKRVLAVAPVAAGKGTMAAWLLAEVARSGKPAAFVVHRREIVFDIAKRVRRLGVSAGVILGGQRADAKAQVQVGSIQTLLASGARPKAHTLIVDEAHHYAADDWKELFDAYPKARVVGFTATPQRSDGRSLGDAFDSLVVVATYGEMLAVRRLVPCGVLRPERQLGIDLAQDPVDAYFRYANGMAAMVFTRRVDDAHDAAKRFRDRGVNAQCIEATTPKAYRDEIMRSFDKGSVQVVTNVAALGEGTDVPRVQAIVMARNCEHASTYVQMVGRGLRAHPGKDRSLLIDLTGVSYKHGLPTDERAYSLGGDGMGGNGDGGEGGGSGEREEQYPEVLGLALVPIGIVPEISKKQIEERESRASKEADFSKQSFDWAEKNRLPKYAAMLRQRGGS